MIVAKIEEILTQRTLEAERFDSSKPVRVHLRCRDDSFFAINWTWFDVSPELGAWYRFEPSFNVRFPSSHAIQSIGDWFTGSPSPTKIEPEKPLDDSKLDYLWRSLVDIMKLLANGYTVSHLNEGGIPVVHTLPNDNISVHLQMQMRKPEDK